MIKKIGRFLLLSMGLLLAASCEQEDKLVGASVLGGGSTVFEEKEINVHVANMFAASIRSDRNSMISTGNNGRISGAIIGVYEEPIFGKTKSSLYLQPRLASLVPNFGKDPQLDSIVMYIPVTSFKKDTLNLDRKLIETNYIKPVGDECKDVTDTVYTYRDRRKFEVDSLYGNKDAIMKLQVHQVIEPMLSVDSVFYSNRDFAVGKLVGEREISKYALTENMVKVSASTKDDRSKDSYLISEKTPSYKIRLDGLNDLVYNEIIKKPFKLTNQAIFVNKVLNGLKISVTNDQGFLVRVDPSNIMISVYYNRKNETFKDENNDGVDDREEKCDVKVVTPRVGSIYQLALGGAYNVYQSRVVNEQGSIDYKTVTSENVYLEGMGGSFAKLHLDDAELGALRDSVEQRKWAITEAYVRLYPNESLQGTMPLPPYLHVYNYSGKKLIPDYTGNTEHSPFIFGDISRKYSKEKGYYQLKITRFLKNIIEKNEANADLALEMGNYYNPDNLPQYQPNAYWATDQIQNPYRLIANGNNSSDKRIKLIVKYTKKQ